MRKYILCFRNFKNKLFRIHLIKIFLLSGLFFGFSQLKAQTVLISPTGDGGFETGASLALNGWTAVNTTAVAWFVGTAAGVQGGTNAAFIGSNATTYGGTATAVVKHFYRDVVIPAGATAVYLNYYLKMPIIDNGWDYFYIFTTTTANTPVSGIIPGAGYTQRFSNTATAYATFTAMTQIDLTALAGTTVRLVFTYKCDGVSPYANPAVDNISLVYTPGAGCGPTYATLPATESFESAWLTCGATTNQPNDRWKNANPATGNNSWRRNDAGASASWSTTNGAFSPTFSVGAYSARFHSYDAGSGTQGNLDFYVDLSPAGTKNITFDHINTSGTDVLSVWLSTDGGSSFPTQLGANVTTSAVWTNKAFTTTSTSATAVIRLKATSDYGTTDIGVDNVSVSVGGATPSITLANNGTQVAAANVGQGTTAHILHKSQLTVATANATLTGMTCTTTGTCANTTDITNLKVRYSADATLDAGDVTLSTITPADPTAALTFTSFTPQVINSGTTGYIFITADIGPSATTTRTIACSALTTADFTFSSGTKSGSTTAGGTQTIIAGGPANDACAGATALPCGTSNLAGTTVGCVSETAPSTCVGGYGVWYTFTGDGTSTTISSVGGAGFDQGMYIAYGTCASRTQVACVDAGVSGGTETSTFTSTNGTTYFVYIAYYTGATTGTFTISRTCTGGTPSITLADNGTQVTAANVSAGTTAHILHKSQLAVATANATLTGMTVTTTGTCANTTDITNLKVRYSADATLDAGDPTLSTITPADPTTTLTFTPFTSQIINSGSTGYIFITADVGAGATAGRTIAVSALTTADFTFSSGTKSGSTTAGGTQTVTGPSPCSTVTAIGGCGAGFAQTYTGGGTGSWSPSSCGFTTSGIEKIYSFVAPTNGTYSLVLTAASGYVDYQWQASTCASSGWTCIQDITATGTYGSMAWTAGTTYYILLDDENTTTGTHTFYVSCPPTPPVNDNCAAATSIHTDVSCGAGSQVSGTIALATNSGVTACAGTADDDVWFSFVAEATSQFVTLGKLNATDFVTQFFTGACGSLTSAGCYDADPVGQTWTGLTIGNTYYIRVYSWGSSAITGANADFTVCVQNPNPQDGVCGATTLTPNAPGNTTCTGPLTGNTSGATQTYAAGPCDFTSPARDIWYKFVATANGHTVSVTGNGTFDPVVQCYTATNCSTSVSAISGACSDATGAAGTETVELSALTVGTTYYVRVYHASSAIPANTTFSICIFTPPVNDEPCGAFVLTPASPCSPTAGDAALATETKTYATCDYSYSSPARDVWYKFTATNTAHAVSVTGNGTFDPVLQAYTATNCSTTVNAISGACADDNGAGASEMIELSGLTIGTVYYVRVYHGASAIPTNTTFTICVLNPPANDEACGAVTLTPNTPCTPTAGEAALASQTKTYGTCDYSYSDPARDVWYKFVATNTSHMVDVTGNGTYDPIVQAYTATGTCPTLTLTAISGACMDDTYAGETENLELSGLTVGTTYYVRVYHGASSVPTNTTFTICIKRPPANDELCGAVTLTSNPTCVTTAGDAAMASQTYAYANCDYSYTSPVRDVWYKFTATYTSHEVRVAGNGTYDPITQAYTATNCSTAISAIAGTCTDNTGAGATEVMQLDNLTIGTTYYIRVYHGASSIPTNTTFTICVIDPPPPPANDVPCGAINIAVGATCTWTPSTSVGATNSNPPAAPPCGNYNGRDVWYKFTMPASGNVNITTDPGGMSNAAMAAYRGVCGALILLDCNDELATTWNGLMPEIRLRDVSLAGQTIWIRIWPESGSSMGTFDICAYEPIAPLPCNGNPIPNDRCVNATPICEAQTYCGETSDYYSRDFPGNMCQGCGLFDGSIENNSWLSFQANAANASLHVVVSNCSNGIQMGIYSGTCAGFTLMSDIAYTSVWGGQFDFIISAASLTPGSNYFIMIDGYAGDVCDYTITPVSGISVMDAGPDQCNAGAVQLQATGGTSYTWSPAGSLSNPNIANPIANPSGTTIYTVSGSGSNPLCPVASDYVAVFDYTVAIDTSNNTNLNCYGYSNGQATPVASGGGNPYTYSWSSGQSTQNISGLPAGIYTVTVTNTVSGCTNTAAIVISQPPQMLISTNGTNTQCDMTSDGTVTVSSITNGTGPYSYLWNTAPPQTTQTATGLPPGNYYVTITDAAGCTEDLSSPVTVSTSYETGVTYTWRGTTSTAWTTASNWCRTGSDIPNHTSHNVIIPPGAPFLCNIPNNATSYQVRNITINGTLIDAGSTSSLLVGENWNNNGSFTENSGTITFNGSGSHNIGGSNPTTFGNLTIDKAGIVSYLLDVTINKNLTFTAGSLDATVSNNDIYIKGNWLNNGGTFVPRQGWVYFNGSAAQIAKSNNNLFANVEIINTVPPAGIDGIVLDGNMPVSETLMFTDGSIITGGDTVIVSNPTGNKVIYGPGNSNYLNSWVFGNIKRFVAQNTDSYDFPVGTAQNAFLARIKNNSSFADIAWITAWFDPNPVTSGITNLTLSADGAIYELVSDGGIWVMTPETGTDFNYDLSLYFNTNPNFLDDLLDYKFGILSRTGLNLTDPNEWNVTNLGTLDPTAGRIIGDGYAYRKNLATFSHKGIGVFPAGALPIELLMFDAVADVDHTDLSWTTVTEINNDFFTIERSADAVSFQPLFNVDGAGNSNGMITYSDIDPDPLPGWSYYRLKQTDFDGSFSFSAVKPVFFGNSTEGGIISTFTDNDGSFNILYAAGSNSGVGIKVYDYKGSLVFNKFMPCFIGENLLKPDISALAHGLYFLMVTEGSSNYRAKILLPAR